MQLIGFYLPGDKWEKKSAADDDKPFLVELIQTVLSNVRNKTETDPQEDGRPLPSIVHLIIYIFSSVLLHNSI